LSTTSSNRNKIIAAIVLILIIVVGAGWYVTQKPTPTPTTTGTTVTTASGLAVPNTDTLIEEVAREPGPGGYDPALSWDAGANYVMENVYETLVYYDGARADKFIPWLAQSWDVSPDGLVYTFHLRQGIMFQDGTPFNATAVKFSIDRAILINHEDGPQSLIAPSETMAIKGGPRYFVANTVHNYNASEAKIYLAAGGVKVIDPYTVQITLEHPYAAAIATMAFSVTAVVSPSFVIANCPGSNEMPGVMPGAECEYLRTHAAGTGPFKLTEVVPKVQTVLERYDGYWGGPNNSGPAKLKRYNIKYVPEVGSRELDLFAGTADSIQLSPANAFDFIDKSAWLNNKQIKSLKPGIRIWTAPTMQFNIFFINPRVAPLDNAQFRQALAYAFPYQKFFDTALNGFATKLNGFIPNGMLGYDPTLPAYDYNPDKASELFKKVGYKGTLEFIVNQADRNLVDATLLLKDSLQQVAPDIHLDIKELDTATWLTLYHNFGIQIRIGSWSPDIADSAPVIANFVTDAGFPARFSKFDTNDTITRMALDAAASLDPAKRAALYREIQLEIYRKVPYIPIYTVSALFAERDWVLPSDSPIGRGLFNPEYGDGDGGSRGGYHAYYVWKADTTQQINIDLGNNPLALLQSTPFQAASILGIQRGTL